MKLKSDKVKLLMSRAIVRDYNNGVIERRIVVNKDLSVYILTVKTINGYNIEITAAGSEFTFSLEKRYHGDDIEEHLETLILSMIELYDDNYFKSE